MEYIVPILGFKRKKNRKFMDKGAKLESECFIFNGETAPLNFERMPPLPHQLFLQIYK